MSTWISARRAWRCGENPSVARSPRSEEHTSELQSRVEISYAVFCLKKNEHDIQETGLIYSGTGAHDPRRQPLAGTAGGGRAPCVAPGIECPAVSSVFVLVPPRHPAAQPVPLPPRRRGRY